MEPPMLAVSESSAPLHRWQLGTLLAELAEGLSLGLLRRGTTRLARVVKK